MNIHKMISELQAEKQRLDDAIAALERLSATQVRPKKRPAKAEKSAESLPQAEVSHPRTQ